jgi:hypothetical protein
MGSAARLRNDSSNGAAVDGEQIGDLNDAVGVLIRERRSRTELTTLKIVVWAPIPSARVNQREGCESPRFE